MSRESRWFWIPAMFAVLMFITLVLRWLPAALSRAHDAAGVVQVIGGDLTLAWKALLRCGVAYIATALALDWLPPIRWSQALVITVVALISEIAAEFATSAIIGPKAGVVAQLAATAIAYSATMAISIMIIQSRSSR